MKALLIMAKMAIGFVWLILLLNFFMPFPGKAAIALYILTAFLFMMHGLQSAIFIGAFGDKIEMTSWEKWSILIFGVFALLDIRRKHMM
ncbi:DUF1145 domain-containing protein [Vibrio sp.]|uniref:DUF1145 domain-containing protein n=1 Tax=Vibrio sp. TaxID=678 RepID=UPI00311D8ADA